MYTRAAVKPLSPQRWKRLRSGTSRKRLVRYPSHPMRMVWVGPCPEIRAIPLRSRAKILTTTSPALRPMSPIRTVTAKLTSKNLPLLRSKWARNAAVFMTALPPPPPRKTILRTACPPTHTSAGEGQGESFRVPVKVVTFPLPEVAHFPTTAGAASVVGGAVSDHINCPPNNGKAREYSNKISYSR